MSKEKTFNVTKDTLKIIFENYFIPPWKPVVDIEHLISQPIENLNNFVTRTIIPELFEFLKDREKVKREVEKSRYMDNLSKKLVDAKYLNFKKKSAKDFMRDLINPPTKKNDRDYFLEHQEKLRKELIPIEKIKLDKI